MTALYVNQRALFFPLSSYLTLLIFCIITMASNISRPSTDILEQGWKTLVDHLGTEKAKRFVLSFPARKGNSVQYWKRFWSTKTVDEIYTTIARAKKK